VFVRFLSRGRALQSGLRTDEEHLQIHAQQLKAYFTAKPLPPLPPLPPLAPLLCAARRRRRRQMLEKMTL